MDYHPDPDGYDLWSMRCAWADWQWDTHYHCLGYSWWLYYVYCMYWTETCCAWEFSELGVRLSPRLEIYEMGWNEPY